MRLGSRAVGDTVYLRRNEEWEKYCLVQKGAPGSAYGGFSGGVVLMKRDKIQHAMVGNAAGTKGTYRDSKMHQYLNGEFLDGLEAGIAQVVMEVQIPYRSDTELSGHRVGTMSAKVWLPSLAEVTGTVQEYINGKRTNMSLYVTEGSRLSYWNGANYERYYGWAVLGDRLYGGDYEDLGWSTRTPNQHTVGDYRNLFYKMDCAGYGEISYKNDMAAYPCLVLPESLIVDSGGRVRAEGGAANLTVKIGGVWKESAGVWCKTGGVWRQSVNRQVKIDGVWKE